MPSKFYFAPFIFFFVSACMIAADPETPGEEVPAASPVIAPAPAEISNTIDSAAADQAPTESVPGNGPNRDEIRFVQERMKAAGFDPGPADGVIGPKTLATLQRFQSACGAVGDLLNGEATNAGKQPSKLSAVVEGNPARDEIRLVQTRLKMAGFDPGPIDGVAGAKLKSRSLAVWAGCTALKKFPAAADRRTSLASRKPVHAVDVKTPAPPLAAPASVRDGSSKKVSTQPAPATATPSADEIQLIQVRLKEAGFDPGPIDGILGPKTKSAIQRYRTARGVNLSSAPTAGVGDMLE